MFYTPTPRHEEFILEIGDSFAASNLAPYRGTFKVKDRYEQAGFCYYVSESDLVFRNKDVNENSIKKQIKKSYLFSYVAGTTRRFEIRSGPDMESVFAEGKIETKKKYGFAHPRAFMICSDQDSDEVKESWGKLTAI